MANYIIEGTISEITTSDNPTCTFKICGSEGYSIKRDKYRYNFLCSTENGTNQSAQTGYILFSEREYKSENPQAALLLSSAMASGKRVKLIVESTETEIKESENSLKVTSITLLNT
ncbi:MAG: hypothetical protein IJ530_00325 [Treponema sp.]|uniref:hypothetical protein n=1 Tax=Treponema sp. TaxID=166 RepID=UPI0025DFAD40|nr:hypothetical protein [Treponema sp.]MBQ8678191.1 hypothetical protein [Treponema sp.]